MWSNKPKAANETAAKPVADQKDATGTTYGGAGRPMDLDRARRMGLCFNCGQRGHRSFECPNKKKAVVRAVQEGTAKIEEVVEEKEVGRDGVVQETPSMVARRAFAHMSSSECLSLARELGFQVPSQ